MGNSLPDCKRCVCYTCGFTGICHCPLADPFTKAKAVLKHSCDNFTPADDDEIYCLIGPSGSGKTTIAKKLEKNGYNIIHSYTTRKPRKKKEWGHTFADSYTHNESVIAHNIFNGEHYWAEKEQYEGRGKSIYIIDLPGYAQLKATVSDKVVGIYLDVSPDVVAQRMELDGRTDITERLAHDKVAFADPAFDVRVDANRELSKVLADVENVIRSG